MSENEMQEVCCRDCGESLGYQGGGAIQWDLWEHTRCPVRLARNLGLGRESYEQALHVSAVAIARAYPDFPGNVLDDDPEKEQVRVLRANIAAGCVLEILGKIGFKLRGP